MISQDGVMRLELPLPPSVNSALASVPKTHLMRYTAAARFWFSAVRDEFAHRGKLPVLQGQLGVWVDLPAAMRGDIDNRTKLLFDVLKAQGVKGPKGVHRLHVMNDDSQIRRHYVAYTLPSKDRCGVSLVPLDQWQGYVMGRLWDDTW